ncbi:MAG: DUF6352 family protein [Pseudomonadota bacterium]
MGRTFWKSAGMHLLDRTDEGWLRVTDDFLRAYFTRPELHPVDDSCAAEHALFERLMESPQAQVTPLDIQAIEDTDVQENYRFILRFRDHLLSHGTLESAYMGLFNGQMAVPSMFVDQLTHVVLRNALSDCDNALVLRAAELFFREQTAQVGEDLCMLADAEVVAMASETATLHVPEARPREVQIDILTEETADEYWLRSDRFDTALDFRFTQPGPDALAQVIRTWIGHFHGVETRVQAMPSIRDHAWRWHIGMDSESTGILNALYRGEKVDSDTMWQMIGLYRLEFLDNRHMDQSLDGKPVYLGAAVTSDLKLRLKPQNILTNLPLRKGAAA